MKHTYVFATNKLVGPINAGPDQAALCSLNVTFTARFRSSGRIVPSGVPKVWTVVSATNTFGVIPPETILFTPSENANPVLVTLPVNGDYVFLCTIYEGTGLEESDDIEVTSTPSSYVRSGEGFAPAVPYVQSQPAPDYFNSTPKSVACVQFPLNQYTLAWRYNNTGLPDGDFWTDVEAYIAGTWTYITTVYPNEFNDLYEYDSTEFGTEGLEHRLLTKYAFVGFGHPNLSKYYETTLTLSTDVVPSGSSCHGSLAGATSIEYSRITGAFPQLIVQDVESYMRNVQAHGSNVGYSKIVGAFPLALDFDVQDSYQTTVCGHTVSVPYSKIVTAIPGGIVIGS